MTNCTSGSFQSLTDPPVIDPPVIDPPVIDPPVIDPPVIDQPVIENKVFRSILIDRVALNVRPMCALESLNVLEFSAAIALGVKL